MYLPSSLDLPVNYLSASLDDTTNSYKFYWFIAILEVINNKSSDNKFSLEFYSNNLVIPVEELICRMLANVWYPVNYFHLFFGKQDKLSRAILEIKNVCNISVDSNKETVLKEIREIIKGNNHIKKLVTQLSRYVPYRFLRPWYSTELIRKADAEINDLVLNYSVRDFNNSSKLPLYQLIKKNSLYIEINSDWLNYLQKNIQIITGFVFWNLTNYLQKRNPNVPNISGKLSEKGNRDLKQAKEFWNIVLANKEINCIYSGVKINKDISIDHFIPWSFVTHDLLWNLIPTTKSTNSSKSDSLPDLEEYLLPFAKLQHQAFKIVFEQRKNKLLEDYTILYNADLESIYNSSFEKFKDKLNDSVIPLAQIAYNMGFQKGWHF